MGAVITRRGVIGGLIGMAGAASADMIFGTPMCRVGNMEPKGMPTARDYVQDGLVAMWDGIENAGFGAHDSDATTWKDLVGNNNWSLGEGFNWTEDSLHMTGECGSLSGTLQYQYEEMCFKVNTLPGRNAYRYIVRFVKSSYQQCGAMFSINNYCGTSYYVATGGKYGIIDFDGTVGKPSTFGAQYIYNAQGVLARNGVAVGLGTGTGNTNLHTTNILGQADEDIDLMSLRLYSRIPSNDEIAANYSVDKARFGI